MFDLDAIGRALGNVRDGAVAEASRAQASRGSDQDDARRRMLEGYAFVDALVVAGKSPFVYGGSHLLVEMNNLVLCGTSPARRAEFARHIAATERRFYDDHACGADAFYDWVDQRRGLKPTVFAAGVYRRIVGAPQLFIEGNQRTATLVASYVLGRAGLPPLVRTQETAEVFDSLSAECKSTDRRWFITAFWAAGLDWRLQGFIERNADRRFLAPPSTAPMAAGR